MKLTDAAITRLKPPLKGQKAHSDDLLPGFGLRLSHDGSRTFEIRFRTWRNGERVQTRLALGRHPTVSLAEARQKARVALEMVGRGEDPRGALKPNHELLREASRNTFAAVVLRYLAYCEQSKLSGLKASTAAEYRRTLLHVDLAPLRDMPIAKIAKRDIIEVLDTVAARSPSQARHLRTYLSGLFNWSVSRDLVAASPITSIRPPAAVNSRHRVLSLDELGMLWRAADAVGGVRRDAIRLLILTGQRSAEIAGLEWSELHDLGDPSRARIELPPLRVKNSRPHTVPLSRLAVGILGGIKRTESPRVFLGDKGMPIWKPDNRLRRRLDAHIARQQAEARVARLPRREEKPTATDFIAPWVYHDIRRSFVTLAGDLLSVPPHVVETAVNHTSGVRAGIAGVYNKASYAVEVRALMEKWSELIASNIGGTTRGSVRVLRK